MSAAVFGGGRWGATLAWLLGEGTTLWTRAPERWTAGVPRPAGLLVTDSLEEAAAADLLFFAVPPARMRPLARALAPHLRASHRAVHACYGFEPGGTPISQVLDEETLLLPIGALAGPVVPEELWRGGEGAIVVGSRYQALIDEVTDRLASPHLRVYGNRDLAGVEAGGALRTPYALASGLLQGQGKAVSAVLLTRAVAEAGRLALALGGDTRTVAGLSGLGDWLLTSQDDQDELMRAAKRLREGGALDHAEAAARVGTVRELAARVGVELPIVDGVAAVLGGRPLGDVVTAWMSRRSRPEFDR